MLGEREHGDVSSCLTTVYRWCVWTASAGPILTHKQHLSLERFFDMRQCEGWSAVLVCYVSDDDWFRVALREPCAVGGLLGVEFGRVLYGLTAVMG